MEDEKEGVDVELMGRERRRKRTGRMRRGWLRWKDMAVRGGEGESEWVLVCILECVILYRFSQCLLGLQGIKDEFPSNQLPRSLFPPFSVVVFMTSLPDP